MGSGNSEKAADPNDDNNDNYNNQYNNFDMNGLESKTLIEIFKLAPAIVALFGVIYLLYRIIVKKDETIKDLVRAQERDVQRQTKLITLLEILVSRGKEG